MFSEYTAIGSKDAKSGKNDNVIFRMYSNGIKTHRDAWIYNSSKKEIEKNMRGHINYCNSQNLDKPKIDPRQAKWTGELSDSLKKSDKQKFEKNKIRSSLYRPFFKQHVYFDKIFVTALYQIPKIFPENDSKNISIIIPHKIIGRFSTFITDITPDLQIVQNDQCFPLYIYENGKNKKSNILNSILQEYQNHYNNKGITKKDIFYYVYGLFHHIGYKQKFANNLSRELPHIPMAPDFWAFNKAGKELADMHLNFDTCNLYDLGEPKVKITEFAKISFSTKSIKKDGKTKQTDDKTKIRIDGVTVFENIPEIKYQVNGRTPLEWLIDRYRITVDKESGIRNDPCTGINPISLIQRAVYIGVESDKIITELSKKEFEPKNWTPAKTGLDSFSDPKEFQ